MGRFERLFHLRLWRPTVDEGIDWEIRHHLEERMDELKASGLGEEEARAEAERSFGGTGRLRSELRRIDRGQRRRQRLREFISSVGQDVRYGARGVMRNAGFSVAVVLTLALGIGANGALFSVADALLLRPLPFADPDELVEVFQVTEQATFGQPYVAPVVAREWLRGQTAASSAFIHHRATATYTGGGEPVMLPGLAVSETFEETLGVPPMMGRGLAAPDAVTGAAPVALVSFDFWSRELGRSADAVGAEVELNGIEHTIIGVMPRDFKYPLYSTTDIWLPLYDNNELFGRPLPYVGIVARVDGGGMEPAQASAAALASALIEEHRPGSGATFRLAPMNEQRADATVEQPLKLLTGAVAMILLIAGVNMVNLLLLRGAARTREIAVRMALGASRWRLVRQLGTESMLLALLSGVLATFLAFLALRVLQHVMPSTIVFWAPHTIQLRSRTLLFTFCLAAVSGLLFGMLPAVRATRLAGAEADTGLAPHTSAQPAGSAALRRVLVTSEVALAVTLLVGAGLLIGSFVRLTQVDPGMELDRLAVLGFSISSADYPDAQSRATYLREVEERIRAVPGVESMAITSGLPPRGGGIRFGVVLQTEGGDPRPLQEPLPITSIGSDFFEVTGARLIAGRPFDRSDTSESGSVIIDEHMAAHLWPGSSAVGRRFRSSAEGPWHTVVGVMGDLKLRGPADDRMSEFELAYPIGTYEEIGSGVIAIRTAGDPRAILQPVRAVVHDVNPRQVIETLDTAESLYAESLDMQRFLYVVITTLALVALALTAVGLYGLLAYGVARRRREIGVRLALGARGRDVHRIVLGEALALTAAGAVIGGAGAVVLSRFIEATLYGIEPTDPQTFALVATLIFGVATVASVLPAKRAASVDPAAVLRSD